MIDVIFRQLLDHFAIAEVFPEYLYEQTFNEVFLDGEMSEKNGKYKIVITTRQDVTHQMFLNPSDEFPVVILSRLPNGSLNGMKFARTEGQVTYINNI